MINTKMLSAFSLLEMAIVISIMGVLLATALPSLMSMRMAHKQQLTETKCDHACYALASFALRAQRLPFPADPTALAEQRGIENPALSTGILPYRTLGLSIHDSFDGFSHPMSYTPSPSLTRQQASSQSFCQRQITAGTSFNITNEQNVSVLNMSLLKDFVAFVLVSHGPSGAGAFDQNGQRRPAHHPDKIHNSDGNYHFIDRPITADYDDRVRWVTRNNLMALYGKHPCNP
jgi:prepilin-type N-terminal cleavage/methylation domain-containing protein